METIKVNMTPCEDIKTIHASQNDNEAREWGFELHNNGEKIDSSSISDQLVFKAYEGGTEQILPENGSTPTTSPFLGDIRYPQGLLTDQEFLYRESPTEENGLAKITDIKGNTLVWNQLVQNTSATWLSNSSTQVSVSFDANTNTATITGLQGNTNGRGYTIVQTQQNHKYLVRGTIKASVNGYVFIEFSRGWVGKQTQVSANTETYVSFIVTPISATDTQNRMQVSMTQNGEYVLTCKNMMCIDLTKMGLDISDPSDFTSLFPLPYYNYNAGSLLSFNGTGIKATGVNLFNINNYSSMDSAWTLTDGVLESNNNRYKNYVSETITGTGKTYTLSFKYNVSQNRTYAIQIYNKTDNVQVRRFEFQSTLTSYSLTDVLESGKEYDIRVFGYSATSGTIELYDVQLQLGFEATSYKEYIEPSTLSLPIAQYFPTGMKSAGNVYDELTESKASERVGSMTLDGSQSASVSIIGSYTRLSVTHGASNVKYPNAQQESNYLPYVVSFAEESSHFYANGSQAILIMQSSVVGTTVDSFNSYLQSHPLTIYYELATPTETSFTTASLVTENAEIPLSNEDGTLIGKCTEELSAEPGFYDAKIKLADADGECYSNKIQLHVERSPQ